MTTASPDPTAARRSTLADDGIATQAAEAARTGAAGRERAAALLLRHRSRRLQGFFRNNKVGEAEAEELTSEVVLNFITQPPQDCPAEVWLWTLARNELIDWARKRAALSRGGSAQGGPLELAFDADAWLAVQETVAGDTELPAWVRNCVQRAAAQFEKDEPLTAQVLLFKAQGWSAREIAVFFGAPPARVSKAAEGAARDRVYRACQLARDYFQHCKE
ncbi:RNA polymerase sigma factor [Roseateles sp. LYH14W]|uniref:RNA polymerase sigma factor n=1 Tax=Pelomonas parva TaxID=3299032 RepID=A0ABW7F9V6_9BURK